jgi:hypothetical protein
MRRQFLRQLMRLRPIIKACWEVLLRDEPPPSALGNPDTLVFMMDGTLEAFFAALRSPTPRRWLAHHPLLTGTLPETCPCGRNPLLPYYQSGEQAVLAIAAQALDKTSRAPAAEQERLLADVQIAFHYLAQHELQAFCDLCRGTCRRARAGLVTGKHRGPPPPRRQPRRLRAVPSRPAACAA